MKIIRKDITTIQAPALIAHGVNTQNAMGSGVARALYMKWPVVKAEYHSAFKSRSSKLFDPQLGSVQFVEVEPGLVVANCFTQQRYGRGGERYASTQAIHEALWKVGDHAYYTQDLRIGHTPRSGAGLGGLDWEDDVVPVLEVVEDTTFVEFVVCDIGQG